MDGEKKIEAWQQELIMVRSGMEEMGPVVIGTISSSRKKYRTKDGEVRVCGDTAVLKFAGTGKNLTVRIPKDKEKLVRKMIDNGRTWRDLNKRYILLSSRLAVYGALKKTTCDADTQVRESSGDSCGGKRRGDGRRVGKNGGAT